MSACVGGGFPNAPYGNVGFSHTHSITNRVRVSRPQLFIFHYSFFICYKLKAYSKKSDRNGRFFHQPCCFPFWELMMLARVFLTSPSCAERLSSVRFMMPSTDSCRLGSSMLSVPWMSLGL